MAAHGGLITLDDLAQYRAIERRPLAGRYRDHAVYSAPPPVSTGLALIETLQILENYQPQGRGASYATDADYFHYAIEAWKVRDQSGRIADPALWTSISDRTSIRRTRRRCSSGSIRRKRRGTAAPTADHRRRRSGSAAAPRPSPSPTPTAT